MQVATGCHSKECSGTTIEILLSYPPPGYSLEEDDSAAVQPLRQKASFHFNPVRMALPKRESRGLGIVGKVAVPGVPRLKHRVTTCRWVSGLRLDRQCELV